MYASLVAQPPARSVIHHLLGNVRAWWRSRNVQITRFLLKYTFRLGAIGAAQWLLFADLSKSAITNGYVFAGILVAEVIILGLTFRRFWRALRAQWTSNWLPAIFALVYVSQFLALMSILDWGIATELQHSFAGGQYPYGLTKTDAFYFAVTTFSTVGYGDIHANSPAAKLVVAFQIILGLLLSLVYLGVFVSLLASRLSRKESQ